MSIYKRCIWCDEVKLLEDFNGDSRSKDGKTNYCKQCKRKRYYKFYNDRAKRISQEKKLKRKETRAICYKCNKERFLLKFVVDAEGNLGMCKICDKREEATAKVNFSGLKTCTGCKAELSTNRFRKFKGSWDGYNTRCKGCEKKVKELREQKDGIKEYNKNRSREWKKLNKENINRREREKRQKNTLIQLECSVTASLNKAIRQGGFNKKTRTSAILGCSWEQLKLHIESQFQPWMNWGNRGGISVVMEDKNKFWDIDHIIPLATAKTEKELLTLCHYTNLQPLCSVVNRYIKRDNLHFKK